MSPEDLRFEVRRHLYARPTAALDVDTIRHGMARKGLEATNEEITAALTFLMGLQPAEVQGQVEKLGSTKRYQITTAGVLAYERNE